MDVRLLKKGTELCELARDYCPHGVVPRAGDCAASVSFNLLGCCVCVCVQQLSASYVLFLYLAYQVLSLLFTIVTWERE